MSQIIQALQKDPKNTSDFILEKVAPIFNKKGYSGTSLSDLTAATGLTKGALYFYFENKQDLAVQAFKTNVRNVVSPLAYKINQCHTAVEKIQAIVDYYRHYYNVVGENGGCPILNMGTDANNSNPELFEAVKKVIKRLEGDLVGLIQKGIDNNEIKPDIDAVTYGKNIYSMMEGSVFTAITHKDASYMEQMMDFIDTLIKEKLIK